ncbi:MAG: heavy-metal-associated domain-containing protein [Ruminococcaceae bacterium]|nr:heavy-metal-associated domain-containing protein [Oscillospiraceae bacterium]
MDKITVKIDGMMCGMCEAHIKDVIRKVCPEAKKVTASHTAGEATFVTDGPVDEERLRAAIDETGYSFLSVSSAPYEKKRWFGRS